MGLGQREELESEEPGATGRWDHYSAHKKIDENSVGLGRVGVVVGGFVGKGQQTHRPLKLRRMRIVQTGPFSGRLFGLTCLLE